MVGRVENPTRAHDVRGALYGTTLIRENHERTRRSMSASLLKCCDNTVRHAASRRRQ